MSTVLGMMMMMPVVFGVGGYALVSRRPEINANTMTLVRRRARRCLTRNVRVPRVAPHIIRVGGVISHRSQYIDGRREKYGERAQCQRGSRRNHWAVGGTRFRQLKRAPPARLCGNPAECIRYS